ARRPLCRLDRAAHRFHREARRRASRRQGLQRRRLDQARRADAGSDEARRRARGTNGADIPARSSDPRTDRILERARLRLPRRGRPDSALGWANAVAPATARAALTRTAPAGEPAEASTI